MALGHSFMPHSLPAESLSRGIHHLGGLRTILIDTALIGFTRRDLIGDVGLSATKRLVLRLGFAQGWRLAASATPQPPDSVTDDGIHQIVEELVSLVGLGEAVDDGSSDPLLITVAASCEAEEHRRQCGPTRKPVCWFACGYVSGYLSHVMGVAAICREEACRAVGDDVCRFRLQILADTPVDLATPDPFADTACPHLLLAVADDAPDTAEDEHLPTDQDVVLGMRSPRMRALVTLARRAASVDSTVLVTGESGVGKERLARLIHDYSDRRRAPFIPVNCGALPPALLESELFGHTRGAFTGAVSDKKGLFEAAERGTIFLDEIAEMRLDLQVTLLRVLQEREVRRLGDTRTRSIDVRVIAATNRDLQADLAAHRFRDDLYYRLAVISFHVPPLRDRDDDLRSLIDLLVHKAARRFRRTALRLSPRARDTLLMYHWPGNIRELENAIEAACALAPRPIIDVTDLPEYVRRPRTTNGTSAEPVRPLRDVEREYILSVLRRTRGNRKAAARHLAIAPKTLYRKLQQYNEHGGEQQWGGQNDRPRSE